MVKSIDSFITNDKLITINKNQLKDPFNVMKISGKSIDGVNSKIFTISKNKKIQKLKVILKLKILNMVVYCNL